MATLGTCGIALCIPAVCDLFTKDGETAYLAMPEGGFELKVHTEEEEEKGQQQDKFAPQSTNEFVFDRFFRDNH